MEDKKVTKVNYEVFQGFELWYFDIGKTYLRYGQAFLNLCLPGVIDPELFYQEDKNKAKTIIFLRYIE